LASSAAPQQQFDLVCTGTLHSIRVTLAPQTPDSAYSSHYRIDLKAGKWCEGKCVAVRAIAEVQPGFLRLQEESKERSLLGNPGSFRASIDRTTGDERMMDEDNDQLLGKSLTTWHGKCEAAPFSGFQRSSRSFERDSNRAQKRRWDPISDFRLIAHRSIL
jgi:hypothetical protein